MADARGKIVVIDDVPANRYTLARVLRAEGYEVIEGENGADALRLTATEQPDMIVLDVKLPDMLGFDVTERLRAWPETAHVSVLQVSASYTSADAHAEGLARGADGYLVHPIEPKVLTATVRALLRLRSAERRAQELLGQEREATAQAEHAKTIAERAVRLRDDFLSIAAHELRTPLMALHLQLDSLRRILADDARCDLGRANAKAATALRQSERLETLVEALLTVAQIHAGRLRLDLDAVDLREVLSSAAECVSEVATRAACEVRLSCDGPLVGTWDRCRLDQVLIILLSNAIKYGAGRPVEARAEARGTDLVQLTVRDYGIGIAEADRERVFERFGRAVSMRNYGGLGLGLYIARQIVQAHGGQIEVRSAPGGGSLFEISLPRVTCETTVNVQ